MAELLYENEVKDGMHFSVIYLVEDTYKSGIVYRTPKIFIGNSRHEAIKSLKFFISELEKDRNELHR